jgi:hypothetical protein
MNSLHETGSRQTPAARRQEFCNQLWYTLSGVFPPVVFIFSQT